MIIVGLTGSMAMGKSTATNMLADMSGVAVLCSDDVVRGLYDRPEIIELVKNEFPDAYDRHARAIDKRALLGILANDHEKWDAIEEILHPFVLDEQNKFLQEQQRLGTKIAVLDIPLLFETEGDKRVDYTICLSAPEFIQAQRIQERINRGLLTEDDAAFRLSRQMPDQEKKRLSDYVIPTGQGIAVTRKALEDTVCEIKRKHFSNGNECNRPPSFGM